MKVKMLTALSGPETNHQPGDIVETNEGARWIEAGIAELVPEEPKVEPLEKPVRAEPKVETAAKSLAKEKAATRTKKAV